MATLFEAAGLEKERPARWPTGCARTKLSEVAGRTSSSGPTAP